MLELVVFTEKVMAKRTTEYSASVVPDTALTLHTLGISQGTGTSMCAQALPAMANPGFAKITYRAHHGKASTVDTSMLYDTV